MVGGHGNAASMQWVEAAHSRRPASSCPASSSPCLHPLPLSPVCGHMQGVPRVQHCCHAMHTAAKLGPQPGIERLKIHH